MSGITSIRLRAGSPEHIAAISAGQKAAAARRSAGEGFIYVAAIRDTDAVKVGFSLQPEMRATQLGSGVRMLGFFPASIHAEREFHAAHRSQRHPDFSGQEIYPRSVFAEAA